MVVIVDFFSIGLSYSDNKQEKTKKLPFATENKKN